MLSLRIMPMRKSIASSVRNLRRLPEKHVPECAGFSYAFKARRPAHSKLCNGWRNAEGGRKDRQAGICFDRNRLRPLSRILVYRFAHAMKVSSSLLGRLSILAMIGCGASWGGPQASGGKTIYKWTDAEGTVHFSDQVPTAGAGVLESQPLPAAVPTTHGASDDYYSIENQARRFEEARRTRLAEREQAQKAREERQLRQEEIEAARARREAAEAQKKVVEYPRGIYVPGYPVPPVHPAPPPKPPMPPEPEPERPKMSLPRGIVR